MLLGAFPEDSDIDNKLYLKGRKRTTIRQLDSVVVETRVFIEDVFVSFEVQIFLLKKKSDSVKMP